MPTGSTSRVRRQLGVTATDRAGAWLIHVVLIAAGKVLLDIMPGVSQEGSWTILLQGYTIVRGGLACPS